MTLHLFAVFLKIGMFSIGGGYAVIPLIRDEVVTRFHWISEKVFADIITISQMTPGPLAVNTSTFVGMKIGGVPGAAAATFGCILAGIAVSLLLNLFFKKHESSKTVFYILRGLKAASLGLIMSAGLTIITLTFFGNSDISPNEMISSLDVRSVFIFAGAFFLLRKLKKNPIFVMFIGSVFGFLLYICF